jgi:hypothetical protein
VYLIIEKGRGLRFEPARAYHYILLTSFACALTWKSDILLDENTKQFNTVAVAKTRTEHGKANLA